MTPQLSFERTPVTLLLMATMTALELFGLFDPDPETRLKFYNQYLGLLPSIWNWEPLRHGEFWRWPIWRPFTTTLLHGGPLHAFFNIYILALFGSVIENWLRWHRMLLLVVFLAFASSLSQFFWTNTLFPAPDRHLAAIVGFSGVNYGLFGLLWFGRRYRSEFALVCTPSLVQWMIGWFFLCILLTYLSVLPVANVAHGVGLGFGVLIALTVFRAGERWKWGAALAIATALVLAILVAPDFVLRGALAFRR
jgi:membrane associated rhomboid family serine protease